MSSLKEEELTNILPKDGPTVKEVKKYLEKYNGEFIVIKCGGSVLVDPELFKIFIEDVVVLNKLGFNPIIVHGGGKRINSKLSEVNIKSNFINGLRVTDKDTIDIVENVLIEFNKEIVEALNSLACKAKRITSKENNIITVIQENKDLGFVGTPTEINKALLTETIKANEVPVVAPLGSDKDNQTFNINADTAAGSIAIELKARRLMIISDVEGVLDSEKKLIPEINSKKANELIDQEDVTLAFGVPTIWMGLLAYCRENNKVLSSVKNTIIGGSALSLATLQEFDEVHDVNVIHAWGMTEMSPLGTATSRTKEMDDIDIEQRYDLQQKQGKAFFGVDMTIADDDGNELPNDGVAFGRLLVKGPTIVERYFKAEESAMDDKGWFDTGDVAKIHPEGYMEIVDRSKDVIKSGGEWISSIDLENAAVGHPGVAEACVIGVLHAKWDERPLLLIVKATGQDPSKEDINSFLEDKVVKWWLPDDIVFVEELPHTATGKLLKTGLREDFKNHLINK